MAIPSAVLDEQPLTLGEVGDRLGCQAWRVRELFVRGLLPEPPRIGRARIVYPGQLADVKVALLRAGYLKEGSPGPRAA